MVFHGAFGLPRVFLHMILYYKHNKEPQKPYLIIQAPIQRRSCSPSFANLSRCTQSLVLNAEVGFNTNVTLSAKERSFREFCAENALRALALWMPRGSPLDLET